MSTPRKSRDTINTTVTVSCASYVTATGTFLTVTIIIRNVTAMIFEEQPTVRKNFKIHIKCFQNLKHITKYIISSVYIHIRRVVHTW